MPEGRKRALSRRDAPPSPTLRAGEGNVTANMFFEDFVLGQAFQLGPHNVTTEAIVTFAREFDPQPFHLEEPAGKASILGGLAASGWHTTAVTMRLMCDAVLSHTEVLGSSGMDEVSWLKPVLAGDVLAGEMRVTALRPSKSRPGIGIISFTSNLHDQRGTAKIRMTGMVFVRRRAS